MKKMPLAKKAQSPKNAPLEIQISSLRPHPRNYKSHPGDQLRHIANSIRRNGQYRNIVISEDDVILAGHGVVEALKSLGVTTVSAIRLPLKSDSPNAIKILAADNEVAHLAETDDRALSELLKAINETALDGLFGTGFDEAMLSNLVMVSRPASEIGDIDEAAEWLGMPEFANGAKSLKVIVNFASEDDRAAFFRCVGVGRFTGRTRSIWYPHREKEDLKSVRVEG